MLGILFVCVVLGVSFVARPFSLVFAVVKC